MVNKENVYGGLSFVRHSRPLPMQYEVKELKHHDQLQSAGRL
jgi:hypothetical protein